MRHIFSLFLVMALSTAVFAQERDHSIIPPLDQVMVLDRSQVGDFTLVDTEGDTLNLYQTLDEGKTVFLDLFFTTCSYCIMYSPIIEQVYQATGAGEEDVLFWGISPQDNNQQIDAYKLAHGITNPCAGTAGNGPAAINIITSGQPFLGYPTYCIVCPNKEMQFDVCYPPTVNCMLDAIDFCQTLLFPYFDPDIDTVFAFHDVQFTDNSTGNPTSWEWIFEGGSPNTSTDQNPIVTYDTVGVYDVTLTISDGVTTETRTKEDLITVVENVALVEQANPVIILSPNPASTTLRVLFSGGKGTTGISIYNFLGTEVLTDQITWISSHQATYDLSAFTKGCYLVKLKTGSDLQIRKLIIE